MSSLHSILFVIHILSGAGALVLFWIPMLSKKGQLNHTTYGRYYASAMYAVAGSGALMAIMVIALPMAIKGNMIVASNNPAQVIENIRIFWAFLLYLSLLSFVTTRHGLAVLRVKQARQPLRHWSYIFPLWALLLGGIACLATGVALGRHLHTVFGVLGVFLSISLIRYSTRDEVKKHQWVLEHIGAMIGSGIGAYTAFIAFGGRVFFAEMGQWQIAFWIAPGVIGGIAANVITRRYAKRLGICKTLDAA
ncbi:hypothetical protein [Alteromonas facilis]|uniref:hypothetical protein n=1 Tax=Alteromonas facilis TaxID=2048004 RepID=UPI000C281701|nr:hypothetical protein [Alteromonas facilis]